jgi:hypothetical protein
VRPITGATGPGVTAKAGGFRLPKSSIRLPGRITASRPRKQASATTSRPTRSLHSRLQRWKFLGRASERAEGRTRTPRNVDPQQPRQTTPRHLPSPHPVGPPETFAGAGFLTSGLPAPRGLPTCGPFPPGASRQWIVPLSFRIQWRGPCRPFTGLPFATAKQGAYRTQIGFLSRAGERLTALPYTSGVGLAPNGRERATTRRRRRIVMIGTPVSLPATKLKFDGTPADSTVAVTVTRQR